MTVIRRTLKLLTLAIAAAAIPATARAQIAAGEPPANVSMRIGPLFINPTLALTNAGEDTNVFNDATNPKSDFTLTITPATDLWLRFGPTWIQSTIKEDIVWYEHYASERSGNTSYLVKWLVPLNRLALAPAFSYANTHERPGFEIDTRAARDELGYELNLEYKLFSKTFIGADGRVATTTFNQGETYRGVDLSTELNRSVLTGTLNLRHQLTPLTSVNGSVAYEEDRFDVNPLRNSKSVGFAGSLKFDPAALLKGTASFGYRDFKPDSPDIPAYRGSTMAVDLSYVLLGVTKFAVAASRDVQFSYDINQPYYLQTGGGASIDQQLFGPLDVIVRGGLRRLEYTDRVGAVVDVVNRVDHQKTYGGGVGYYLGRDLRLGVNADYSTRESDLADHQYKGWTYGVSVTYGSGT